MRGGLPTTSPHYPKTSDSTDVTFTVLYDANVLYPNVLRDVLIRLAQTGLVHARWTDRILDECVPQSRCRPTGHPHRHPVQAAGADEPSGPGLPGYRVRGTHPGPDPPRRGRPACTRRRDPLRSAGHRHREPARLPRDRTCPVRHRGPAPDEFVMDLFTLDGARVHQAISATAAAWRNPPGTPADVCDRLAAAGLPISAAALRR